MKKLFLGGALFSAFSLFSSGLYAADFELDNLSQADVDSIAEEFSANFVHTTVTGASSSKILGFQVGIIGRQTTSPNIERLVKEQSPSTEISSIYDAGLMAQVAIPFGISAELVTLPEMDLGSLSVQRTSMAVKWNMSDGFLVIPFNLAIRAHYSTGEISYSDVINNSSTGNTDVNSNIGIKSKSYGANLSASLDLMVVEPYAGFGYVTSDTDVNVDAAGGTTIFNFSAAQAASSSSSGLHYFAGAEVNLLVIKLGAEYSNVYGVDRITGKLGIGF